MKAFGEYFPKHNSQGNDLLRESLALSFQQTMASLGAFELRFHEPQRLPGREDSLAILCMRSVRGWAIFENSLGCVTAAPDILDSLPRFLGGRGGKRHEAEVLT